MRNCLTASFAASHNGKASAPIWPGCSCRERPKTLTALVGAEPWVQAQAAAVQRLQYFLSEASWQANALAARTVAVLAADPLTAPTAEGALIVDDTGDRKDGTATDHVGRQYPGSVGKIDNGIVAVTTLWTNGQHYYPLHVLPYTPAAKALSTPRRRWRDLSLRTVGFVLSRFRRKLGSVLTGEFYVNWMGCIRYRPMRR